MRVTSALFDTQQVVFRQVLYEIHKGPVEYHPCVPVDSRQIVSQSQIVFVRYCTEATRASPNSVLVQVDFQRLCTGTSKASPFNVLLLQSTTTE